MMFLSGGQKSRVAFTILTWKSPHLIIKDEPTNHLGLFFFFFFFFFFFCVHIRYLFLVWFVFSQDIETIDALINAIQTWNGALIVVSHDQYFLRHVAKEVWTLVDAGIKKFQELKPAKKFVLTHLITDTRK